MRTVFWYPEQFWMRMAGCGLKYSWRALVSLDGAVGGGGSIGGGKRCVVVLG